MGPFHAALEQVWGAGHGSPTERSTCYEHQDTECKTRPDQEVRRIFWFRRLRSDSTDPAGNAERARGNGADGANDQDRVIRIDGGQQRQRYKAA